MSYEAYHTWKTTPLTDDPYLSIVIPAYNEAERIVPTIGAIASHVSNLGITWELIVADDGSTDATVRLLQQLDLANLRVLIAKQNGGKGSAIRRGMLAARGEYVLFTDADNSTPIENLSALLQKVEGDYDIAVGSRAADGASESNKSRLRHLMSWGLRTLVRYVLNIRVRDTQCGFKLFTREAAQTIHRAQTIDGFSFDLEELYLANKCGLRVAEVPVAWMDAPGSKVDTKKEAIRFLKDMTYIRWQDARGVYDERLRATHTAPPPISNKRTIAVVSPYPPSKSSLNEYGYHFIKALREKNDEIERIYVLTDALPDNSDYPLVTGDGVPVTLVPCWKFGAADNALRIQSAIQHLQPDVVVFNIQFASFAGTRFAGALGLLAPAIVKYTTGIPTVVLLHNLMETVDLKQAGFDGLEWITRKAGEWITRILLQADLVTLTIPRYVEILTEKYSATNATLAPHGAFDDVPEPVFSEHNNGHLQIMTFGKFGTYKRVEHLIEAYDKLRQQERQQTLSLVIAGGDSPNAPDYLQQMQHEYSTVPNVTFTGYVPEEAVPRIFYKSDVVVFPYTSTTGSSGVLHQAGSYGRAVVLPNIGDFAELIQDEGYTGEFFQPEDSDSLAQAIESLLRDPHKRKIHGQQNYLAARGIPISDVVDWYLMHMERLCSTQ